jgi:hypothetical protein
VADTVASCSNPCMTATLWLLASTLIQPTKTSKQPETRVGSKLPSVIIVARCFNADRCTTLSNDVWSIHEMHRKSNAIACLSMVEEPINQWYAVLPNPTRWCAVLPRPTKWYTAPPKATNQWYTVLAKEMGEGRIALLGIQASATSPKGNIARIRKKERAILVIEYQGRSNHDHHATAVR